MRRCLPLLALVVGCGSTDSTSQPSDVDLTGSYELVMTEITSEGTLATMGPLRLDLRQTASGYEASEFGIVLTQLVDVDVGAGAVVAHSAQFGEVHLPRGADGRFTGAFSAQGSASKPQGDVSISVPFTGKGTVSGDTRPPESVLHPYLGSFPDGSLLPWAPFQLQPSEPVLRASIEAVKVSASEPSPLGVHWQFASELAAVELPTWPGEIYAIGRVEDWDRALGPKLSVDLSGLVDFAGNASATPFLGLMLADLGTAEKSVGFDTQKPAMGQVQHSTDPTLCESGGCVLMGPRTFGMSCGSPLDRVISLLDTSGASKLAVRYRLLAKVKGSPLPQKLPVLLSVELNQPGRASTRELAAPATADLEPGSPLADYDLSTGFATLDVPLAEPGKVAGVVVKLGAEVDDCSNKPGDPAEWTVLLIVDSVSASP